MISSELPVESVYDPLRRKDVAFTPEERVRQWFIRQLIDIMGVPAHLMMSEVAFRSGGRQYRADILIYDRKGRPAAVVECKRPEVEVTPDVASQALRYDAVLSVRFIFLTNGNRTFVFERQGPSFVPTSALPTFDQMQ